MLEDDFNDCLSKAIRGHACPLKQLSISSGISEKRIAACLEGKEDSAVIHSIAPHLQLSADRLIALKDYQPQVEAVKGLKCYTSPFGHLGVNAYSVTASGHCLLFDTGTDPSIIQKDGCKPDHIFITHEHPDHVSGLPAFAPLIPKLPGELTHGDCFKFGDIHIKALATNGHFAPAFAYYITGLEHPICILGDSLFAGSIGGCPTVQAYSTALAHIKDHILNLPRNTILCPGHGPMTTVKQERANNPFLT